MSWGFVAAGVGTVASSYLSSKSSDKAADAQLGAANIASSTEERMFDKSAAFQEPWREAGMGGLNYLQHYLGMGQPTSIPKPERESFTNMEDYQNALRNWETTNTGFQGDFGLAMQGPEDYVQSPYYNFLMEEGTRARENAASATGGLDSGRFQKAITKYGQDLASTDYGNWLNQNQQKLAPFQDISGTGRTVSTNMGNQAINLGTSLANNQMYAGVADAQNAYNQGNIWGNAVTGLGNMAMDYYMTQPRAGVY